MKRFVLLIAMLLAVPASFARAQGGRPSCDGDIAIVRVSAIKPGAMAGFMKAVDAHRAWYRSHGFSDNLIYTARMYEQDPATKAMKMSETEVMTFHVRPPTGAKQDPAWDAYVKQYRDTSDIKNEYFACLPKTR